MLPRLPFWHEVEYTIELIGTLSKLSPIYKLSPFKDQILQQHLKEALEKRLIYTPKSPYSVAVFFV